MSSEFDFDSLELLTPPQQAESPQAQQAESPQEDFDFDSLELLGAGNSYLKNPKEIPKAIGRVSIRAAQSLADAPVKALGGLLHLMGTETIPPNMKKYYPEWVQDIGRAMNWGVNKGGDFLQEQLEEDQKWARTKLEELLGTSYSHVEESISQTGEGIADIVGSLPMEGVLIPATIAATAKQVARELDAPEWVQDLVEAVTFAGKDIGKAAKYLIPKKVKEASGLVLPKIVEKTKPPRRFLKPSVFVGKKEKAYESVAKEAEKIMSEKIKAKYLPMSVEIEEGVDVAARVDQRLDELNHLSSKMTDGIGSDNVLKYLGKVEAEIRAVPVLNTEKKSVLKLIKEYKKKYRSGNYTPKQYIEQYRDINAENKKLYETKWLQGEQPETRKFYTGLQGEISKTIEEGTPKSFGKLFKETNAEYHQLRKLNSFEEVMAGVMTEEGVIDSRKLANIFKSPTKSRRLKKQLGEKGHEHLREISQDLSKVQDKLGLIEEIGLTKTLKSFVAYGILNKLGIPFTAPILAIKKGTELAEGYMLLNPKGFRDTKNFLKALKSGNKNAIRISLIKLDKNAQAFEKDIEDKDDGDKDEDDED